MNRGFRYFVLITIQDEVYTQRRHFASFFGTDLLFFQIYVGGIQGECIQGERIQGDHKGRPYYGRVEPNVGGYLTIGAFALKMRQLHINSSM